MRRQLIVLISITSIIALVAIWQKMRGHDSEERPTITISLENVARLEQVGLLGPDRSVITCVEFSRRNSDLLAFGSRAGYTYLWKFGDDEATQYEYETGEIVDVAFSPDDDYLVAARSVPAFALLFNVDPPKWLTGFGVVENVLTVAFSPDGKTLAFGGEGRIQVSDFEHKPGGGRISLQRINRRNDSDDFDSIDENSGVINSIAYSPDGIHIAAGIGGRNSIEPGGRIKIWNLETMMTSRTIKGLPDAVLDVKYDSTGQFLAAASADNIVRLWELERGRLIMTFVGHTAAVNAVAFSPDGSLLASVGSDGTLRFWDVVTGEQIHMIDLTTGDTENPVWDVDFSADGTMIATASEDGFVRIWGIPEK